MREALFLGDSHSGTLRKGFEARGWRTHGGILQTGKKLEGESLTITDGVLSFTAPRAQERYEAALASIGAKSILEVEMPIFSTLGFNSHRFMKAMDHMTVDPADTGKPFISSAVFERIVAGGRTSALAFYRHLQGKTVFPVHSPQRAQPEGFRMSVAGDNLFAGWLRDLGHDVIDPRATTTDRGGRLKPEYWSDIPGDGAHANERYVDVIVDAVERRLATREDEVRAAE